MPYKLTLVLTPKQAADVKYYTEQAARRAGVAEQDVALVRVVGRSIDARQRQPKVNLTLEVYADCEPQPAPVHFDYPSVAGRTEVVIVGSGPAGLFTALRLIERGYRPVILERGRDVSASGTSRRSTATVRSIPIRTMPSARAEPEHSPTANFSPAARSGETTTKRCKRWFFTALRPKFFTNPIPISERINCRG